VQQSGLRQRKKAKTRQSIEFAAMELFSKHGFEETTVDEIAALAEISQRTFFRYFATKEDVVLADYSEHLAELITLLQQRPDNEHPWDSLRAIFHSITADLTHQEEMRHKAAIILSVPSIYARSLALQAQWEEQLAAALEIREPETGHTILPELMAAAALGIMRVVLRNWSQGSTENNLTTLLDSGFHQFNVGFENT